MIANAGAGPDNPAVLVGHSLGRYLSLRTGLTKNRWMEGKSVVELAKQRGVHVADVISDLAAEEDLETVFHQRFVLDVDTGIMGDMIQDQHVVFGSSDSGAHINSMVQSGEPAYCLRHWVLDHPKLTLEEAVRRLTFVPASVRFAPAGWVGREEIGSHQRGSG
jgi:N-acyl-D-aspartate/D-glutamate deacylase